MLYFTGDVHGNIKGLLYRLDRMGIPHTPDQIIVLLGAYGGLQRQLVRWSTAAVR